MITVRKKKPEDLLVASEEIGLEVTAEKTKYMGGPGSVVDIATAYGLDGPVIESRLGARFTAPVQTGPEDHAASCTKGTGSFLGVK